MGSVSPLANKMRRNGFRTIGLLVIVTLIFICLFSTRYESRLNAEKQQQNAFLRLSDMSAGESEIDEDDILLQQNLDAKPPISRDDFKDGKGIQTNDITYVENEIKYIKAAFIHHQHTSNFDGATIISDDVEHPRQPREPFVKEAIAKDFDFETPQAVVSDESLVMRKNMGGISMYDEDRLVSLLRQNGVESKENLYSYEFSMSLESLAQKANTESETAAMTEYASTSLTPVSHSSTLEESDLTNTLTPSTNDALSPTKFNLGVASSKAEIVPDTSSSSLKADALSATSDSKSIPSTAMEASSSASVVSSDVGLDGSPSSAVTHSKDASTTFVTTNTKTAYTRYHSDLVRQADLRKTDSPSEASSVMASPKSANPTTTGMTTGPGFSSIAYHTSVSDSEKQTQTPSTLNLQVELADMKSVLSPSPNNHAAGKTSHINSTPVDPYKMTASSLIAAKQPPSSCRPALNLIFLKTHKTGSSTVLSIIQRMADHRNLTVALPSPNHHLGWPALFEPRHVFEHEPGRKYNFICHHARFQKLKMLSVMSNPKTKIATIVRDPLYQFESGAIYLNFNHYLKLPKNVSIFESFFALSSDYIRNSSTRTSVMKLVKNPVAFDMGFDPWNETESHMKHVMDRVKRDFDFIMVSDYMSESLLLLRDQLCWTLNDIAYFTMNKRPDQYRQTPPPDAREKVKNWNKIDHAIFEYANATLWKKIKQAGPRFQSDLIRLQLLNAALEEKCLDKGYHRDKSQPWFPILGYQLKTSPLNFSVHKMCLEMIRSEIEYTDYLKAKSSRKGWRPSAKPVNSQTRSV